AAPPPARPAPAPPPARPAAPLPPVRPAQAPPPARPAPTPPRPAPAPAPPIVELAPQPADAGPPPVRPQFGKPARMDAVPSALEHARRDERRVRVDSRGVRSGPPPGRFRSPREQGAGPGEDALLGSVPRKAPRNGERSRTDLSPIVWRRVRARVRRAVETAQKPG